MHNFYLDKTNTFNCHVEVQGADIKTSKSRLLMETKDGSIILFNGTLKSNGECNIEIDNLKKYLKEEEEGKISLEIIVEDTIFTPYESEFITNVSKKVKISEIKSTENIKENSQPKISVKVNINEPDPNPSYINEFKKFINMAPEKDFNSLLEFYIKKRFPNKPEKVLKEIKENLKSIK